MRAGSEEAACAHERPWKLVLWHAGSLKSDCMLGEGLRTRVGLGILPSPGASVVPETLRFPPGKSQRWLCKQRGRSRETGTSSHVNQLGTSEVLGWGHIETGGLASVYPQLRNPRASQDVAIRLQTRALPRPVNVGSAYRCSA